MAEHQDTTDLSWGLTPRPAPTSLTARTRAAVPAALRAAARSVAIVLLMLVAAASVQFSSAEPANAGLDAQCDLLAMSPSRTTTGNGAESMLPNRNLGEFRDGNGGGPKKYHKDFDSVSPSEIDLMNLYEIAGFRGVTYYNSAYLPQDIKNGLADGDEGLDNLRDCGMSDWLFTQVASLIAFVKTSILQGIIALKDAAFDTNPLDWLFNLADDPVQTLFINVVLGFFSIILIAAGISIAIKTVSPENGGFRRAAGAAMASIGAMIVVIMLFGNGANLFHTVRTNADEAISAANNGIAGALLSSVEGGGVGEPCFTPPANDGGAKTGERVTNCIIAYSLAYEPWAIGQFGSGITTTYWVTGRDGNAQQAPPGVGTKDDFAVMETEIGDGTGMGKTGQEHFFMDGTMFGGGGAAEPERRMVLPCYTNWRGCHNLYAYLLIENGGPSQVGGGGEGFYTRDGKYRRCVENAIDDAEAADSNTKRDNYSFQINPIMSQCEPLWATYWSLGSGVEGSAFHGTASINRINQEFVSTLGVLVVGVAIAILAILVLIWHARVFALFVFGPIKLTMAAWPGKSHMVRDYLSQIGMAFVNRLVYGIGVTLVVLTISFIFTADLPMMMKLVWLGVVLFAFWKLLNQAQQSLAVTSSPSAGSGGGGGGDLDGVRQMGSRATDAARTAGGAAVDAGQRGYYGTRGAVDGAVAAKARRNNAAQARLAKLDNKAATAAESAAGSAEGGKDGAAAKSGAGGKDGKKAGRFGKLGAAAAKTGEYARKAGTAGVTVGAVTKGAMSGAMDGALHRKEARQRMIRGQEGRPGAGAFTRSGGVGRKGQEALEQQRKRQAQQRAEERRQQQIEHQREMGRAYADAHNQRFHEHRQRDAEQRSGRRRPPPIQRGESGKPGAPQNQERPRKPPEMPREKVPSNAAEPAAQPPPSPVTEHGRKPRQPIDRS